MKLTHTASIGDTSVVTELEGDVEEIIHTAFRLYLYEHPLFMIEPSDTALGNGDIEETIPLKVNKEGKLSAEVLSMPVDWAYRSIPDTIIPSDILNTKTANIETTISIGKEISDESLKKIREVILKEMRPGGILSDR